MVDTATQFRKVQGIRAEYADAVKRLMDLEDAGADESQIESARQPVRSLQSAHIREMRALRDMWGDPGGPNFQREQVDLIPGKCRAMVGYCVQCSRNASMALGDLHVCTQHYKCIRDGSLVDLFDPDGKGYAGHGVLESFPEPYYWEHI